MYGANPPRDVYSAGRVAPALPSPAWREATPWLAQNVPVPLAAVPNMAIGCEDLICLPVVAVGGSRTIAVMAATQSSMIAVSTGCGSARKVMMSNVEPHVASDRLPTLGP